MTTARELLQSTRELLRAADLPGSSDREAEWLFAAVTGLGPEAVILRPDALLHDDTADVLLRLARRRAAGEPLQYLIGDVEWAGRRFLCDPRALVPRPETECLLRATLEMAESLNPDQGRALHVAEIGTGSGVVAVSLALERPDAVITATDLSSEALELARENARLWGVADRIRLACGDLTEPLDTPADLLVFNPPYVPSAAIGLLQRELSHEPRLALDGGADGLDTYRRMASLWSTALRPDGWFLVEVGAGQHTAVAGILGGSRQRFWDDDLGIVRVVGVTNSECGPRYETEPQQ